MIRTKLTADRMIEKAVELEEILDEMRDLLRRAGETLRGTGIIGRRAEAYWVGGIGRYCDDEAGGSDTSIPETVRELYEAAEELHGAGR